MRICTKHLFLLLFFCTTGVYANTSNLSDEKPVTGIFPEKMLVILAEFKNVSIMNYDFVVPEPQQTFHRLFNEVSFSYDGATGSVRDYYSDNSMKLYAPEFVVVGPVRLPESKSFYGSNIAGGYDKAPGTMVFHACQAASEAGLVNFSEFDSDGDGLVDNVLVIYSGLSEADGAPSINLWPIAGYLSELNPYENDDIYPLELDGVTVNRFIISSELHGKEGEVLTGIGSIAHELGHVFGLVDLYDTVNGNGGLLGWSIMANGSYNNGGKTPPYLNAFEREWLGWGEADVLVENGTYSLSSIGENRFYRINTSNPDEYFLLENRQPTDWDAPLQGHGLLIYHIDLSDPEAFCNNRANGNPEHQYVDILEADGTAHQNSYDGDTFPGSTGKTEFGDNTTPSSILWSGDNLNKSIREITEKDGIISFRFTDHSQSAINIIKENKIYADGNRVYIDCDKPGSILYVYNAQGQIVRSLPATSPTTAMELPKGQFYIIKLNNNTYKLYLH